MTTTLRTTAIAAAFACLLPFAGMAPASAQVPSVPPVATNPTANVLFDAMLAISRANTTNPSGAAAATLNYNAGVQQYGNGNLDAARASAMQAIFQTARPPATMPMTPPQVTIPQMPITPMPYITNVPQADAEEFLALSRRALLACTSQNSPNTTQATQMYTQAVHENLANKYQAVRRDSQTIIDECAPAQAAINNASAPVADPQPPAAPAK